ncbi:hypothetical protein N0V94_007403 [Neodidymelliopsis sp. IMI 364377]|nr:hypothetical protein N0V94_007403 [Neodidymelliopsis sp. IMI 364377]
MVTLSTDVTAKEKYHLQAYNLKVNILRYFYDSLTGIYCLDKSLPASGICQDVKAHAMTMHLLPTHANDLQHLTDPSSNLPRAFRGLGHWDAANVASPYATGFAVEALLSRGQGMEAIKLLERVWGPMADTTSPNYSGGHWEAMKPDGTPHGHDTSLIHGWSTWPVSLMPRYLAGLQPIEPGWKSFSVTPVLAGLTEIKCTLQTVAGLIGVELYFDELNNSGAINVLAPCGVRAQLKPPQGWALHGPEYIEGTGVWQKLLLSETGGNTTCNIQEQTHIALPQPEPPAAARKCQGNSLSERIRSLFARFTAIRA